MLKKIAIILRETGNLQCLKKAEDLENSTYQSETLNLRSLQLNPFNMEHIASIIAQERDNNVLRSISLSYNNQIGDIGAIALVKSLPTSISEIGLVNCGIGDKGGTEILNWLNTAKNLQMICMEQNNFSDELKMKFKLFKTRNPHILVVI